MSRRQQLIVLAGVLISLVFLFLAFQGLNPGDVIGVIGEANIFLLIVAAVWYFPSVLLISKRWGYLLHGLKPLSATQLFPLVCIGYMGNNVYPFRAGEFLRAFLLQRTYKVPVAQSLVVTVIERVFDGLVMLTFILFGLSFLDSTSPELDSIVRVATPLFLVLLVIFIGLAAKPDLLRKLVEWALRILPEKLRTPLFSLSEDILKGFEGFRSPRDLAGAVVFSYVCWGLQATVYWLVAYAFNIEISFATSLLLIGAINLAGLIPASPGQVGIFEFFTIAVLGLVGVQEIRATAYAITVHIIIWLPVTILGFYYLVKQGLGWNAITNAHALEEKAAHS